MLGPNPAIDARRLRRHRRSERADLAGGRIKGDIQQAEATLHQRQAELADQRGRVEQEVRNALIELETAMGQVRAGREQSQLCERDA